MAPEEVGAAAYLKGNGGRAVNQASAPAFVVQPQGGTRYASDDFLLTCVLADDRGPVAYQWYHGPNPILGAATGKFLLTDLELAHAR